MKKLSELLSMAENEVNCGKSRPMHEFLREFRELRGLPVMGFGKIHGGHGEAKEKNSE